MAAIYYGGFFYIALISLLIGFAAWEYARLFHAGGMQPASILIVLGALAIIASHSFGDSENISWLLVILTLLSMTYHLVTYERGRDQAASDFAVTLSGFLYIGLLGSYLILLRNLPEGLWWTLTTLIAIWFADSGAYFYGRRFGKTLLCPRLSPKKTWEGYIAGIVISVIGNALMASLWRLPAGPGTEITALRGALLGLVISILAPLGDLGESMIKRQMGVKDSSNLIPGHGGAFDRIDTWIWAAAIGYFMITWLFI
jgi:phosphatidate cytidylyltransferase